MTLSEELARVDSLFFDTAPVIYYIEADPRFGPLAKEAVQAFQSGSLAGFSSVLTLSEVLAKPEQLGESALARKFAGFLLRGRNFTLLEITAEMAMYAAKLRGKYTPLRTVDSLQLAAAMAVGADAFLTNDRKLKRVSDIKVFVLKDYI